MALSLETLGKYSEGNDNRRQVQSLKNRSGNEHGTVQGQEETDFSMRVHTYTVQKTRAGEEEGNKPTV